MAPRSHLAWLLVVLASCSGPATAPTAEQSPPEPGTTAPPSAHDARFALPDAVAVTIAGGDTRDPVAVWVTPEQVLAAELGLETGELRGETSVSHGIQPFPHPIERPAAVIEPDGQVTIAFVALGEGGDSVYLTRWDRGEADAPESISGSPRPETVLVHATTDAAGDPVLAWLETSTLSVGLPEQGGIVEDENVDDLTCDCCNPAPVALQEGLFVAYRDLDRIDGDVVRDVVALGRRAGGWGEPVAIADDHWFIDACPFSGPSAILADETLVVAWMDARQSVHPDQAGTTVWVDRSEDGGGTFGVDLAVTHGGIHRWPVMARDGAGTIHLVWETQGAEGGLSYSSSSDDGRTFTDPVILVATEESAGSPTSPTALAHDDRLLVSWSDQSGGHVATWAIDDNVGR